MAPSSAAQAANASWQRSASDGVHLILNGSHVGMDSRASNLNDATAPATLATWAARNLPARLDGAVLGFDEHDIQILMGTGKLEPLGEPAPNAPKWFCAIEMIRLATDRDWLHKATGRFPNAGGRNKSNPQRHEQWLGIKGPTNLSRRCECQIRMYEKGASPSVYSNVTRLTRLGLPCARVVTDSYRNYTDAIWMAKCHD